MRRPDSVFFDLDGTLTDPHTGIRRCIEHALVRLGVDLGDDDFRWCIGPPLLESFATLVGPSRAAEALALYRERFSTLGWKENSPYAGIDVALSRLAEAGLTLFVATSKPHVYADRILQHFELSRFFRRTYGAELDGTRADKTTLLGYALHRQSLDTAIMIGDRKHDLIGARANGMRAVAVSYGYGSIQELRAAGAETILDSPQAIADFLID